MSRLLGEGGEILEVAANLVEVLVGNLSKNQTDSHAWSAVGDAGIGPHFRLAEPDADLQALAQFQGNRDFDIASAEAEIGDTAPERRTFLNVNLDRIVTAESVMGSIVDGHGLVVIDCIGGQGEVPESFFGREVEQAQKSDVGGSGSPNPLDAKMRPVRAVGEADDFVEAEVGTDGGERSTLAAGVDGQNFFGKNLPMTVCPEDTYRDFELYARLSAPSHP